MVTSTIYNLGRKSGEQSLRSFCTVNQVKLPFRLRTDDALFEVIVVWEKLIKAEFLLRS